ncbi:MAG TPA: FlgD immunoglobulin-like domain containing protein, partial [Candidatus Kapabacteria bacterium]|nr:FlgD immunoglobulin-like domain containing protein [Candidatus Kapabacteria bacterium]
GDGNLSLSIAIHTDNATLLVEIIDALGNRVALIAQDHYTFGEHTLQWDGFDMNGNKIPAGMYFVRINVNNQQFSTVPYIIH